MSERVTADMRKVLLDWLRESDNETTAPLRHGALCLIMDLEIDNARRGDALETIQKSLATWKASGNVFDWETMVVSLESIARHGLKPVS